MRIPRVRLERLSVALLLLLAACSKGPAVPDALRSLAHEAVTPGESVGTLQLGTTTLAQVLQRYGPGRVSVVAGDEVGFELDYGAGAVSLLFLVTPECRALLRRDSARSAAATLQKEGRLPPALAGCEALPLQSVAVAAPADAATGFFEGRVSDKVGLGSPLEDVLATVGPSQRIPGLWLAGSRPDEGNLDFYTYPRGLALYIGNAPDGPRQGHLVVRKLAIYRPE